jgi:hypothetical protein
MDLGAKRARVLFFQGFSRGKRSGIRIGHFQSKLKTRGLEEDICHLDNVNRTLQQPISRKRETQSLKVGGSKR